MNTSYPFYIKAPAVLLGIALLITLLIVAKPILVPMLICIFISILLMPVCTALEKIKIRRVPSAGIVVILSLTILISLLTLFVTQISAFSKDLDVMEQRADELIVEARTYIQSITGSDPMADVTSIQDLLSNVAQNNSSTLTSSAVSIAGKLIWLVLAPIFIFLMLIYRKFLKEFLIKAIASGDIEKVETLHTTVERVKKLVQSYINGVFTVMLILAVAFYIILRCFGVDHAIFFAVFAGFLSIIPYIGLIIGAAFPAFYALVTTDSLIVPLGIFLAFQFFVFVEGNLLKPYIIGHKVSMNPLTTLLAILVGEMIWGVAGMILIIPCVAILKEIFDQIESLKPYAFLIGSVSMGTDETPGFVEKQIKKIEHKLPKRRRPNL